MKCIGCKYTPSAVLGKECSTIEQSANNWASLPRDLLLSILGRLVPEVSDYIHFASVCKDWFSAARDHQALTHKRPFFPVLLIPAKDNSPTHRGWYNAVENRIVTDSRFRVPYNKSNKLESNSVSVTLRWPAERPLDSAWPGMTYLVGTPYGHLLWINRIHTYKSIGTHKDVRDDIKECLEASELIEENGCIRYRFTSRFEVYEVKKKEGSTTQLVAEPELIKTLDDMVLFLGHNESLLLSTP
ncbi:hypothetical protein CRG98_010896 [Punica granatum]|uniref:F-box domain-containing protein n=1 Tax=Punica granatum TaxID=22663 RepID=A0A2I0KK70_PUNGR|nr:hypothetical protein CRG98_010896 [Punica granatum]